MDNVSIILYICIVIPFLLVLPVLDKKGKRIVLFMAIGLSACLACSFLNQTLYSISGESKYYYTTTVSPVIEEFVKAIPILIFAFAISDELEDILPVSFSLGVGLCTVSVRWAWDLVFPMSKRIKRYFTAEPLRCFLPR